MTRPIAIALVALALGLAVYVAANLRVGTDLMNFMPDGERTELAEVSSRLADSRFTRTMILSLEGRDTGHSLEAARQLAAALRDAPEVAWVRSGVDESQLADLFALYFPRRHYFLSDAPESELPVRFSEGRLREDARKLKAQLATPVSTLLTRIAPADPLSSFRAIAERFRQGEPVLEMRDGQLVTRDGRFAIVMLGTRSSAFESGEQSRLLARIESAFAKIAGGGDDLHLEMSGANRYSVAAEQSVKSDVYRIGSASFLGVAALFLLFVGSLRGFLIVAVPPLAGILVATAMALAWNGSIDGITMVFGASLMGIAIDYSNHLLIHHHLSRSDEKPFATSRRIRGSLVLGAGTTVASFGGLAMTAFPAFREMSFFAAVGVATALAATLAVLPALIRFVPPLPDRARATADWLAGRFPRLDALPRAGLWIPVALLPLAALGISRLEWTDDMSKLTRFDPELIAEDRRVRERASGLVGGRFAIAVADDVESMLVANDAVYARLQEAVAAGELVGTRSLHGLIWSEDLQRRNWRQTSAEAGLYGRVNSAFAQEGFRDGALRAFGEALDAEPPPPLTLADLEASPLADFLTPFVVPLGDRFAAVTYLRGLESPERVRERLAGLEGVYVLDQRSFVNDVYREFRVSTLQQIAVGGLLVAAMLVVRYRSLRRSLAAFLPSVTVALVLLAAFGLAGVSVNLLHLMSLIMVMGMGVDYGVFLVDTADDTEELGATLLSLLMSCLTTVFVFGTLALSSQPSLQAIGVTTGVGIALSYLLAPIALVAFGLARRERRDA